MRKIWLVIFVVVAYVLMGCYEGGDVECYDIEKEGLVFYASTYDFDSAQVYLGNDRICYVGNGKNSSVKKKSARHPLSRVMKRCRLNLEMVVFIMGLVVNV